MAKVSEEGININALVDGIRNKVNDTNPDDREKYVGAISQYLGVSGNSMEEIAPRIKPALQRADSKRLIDIATTLGVRPSQFKSFKEPVGRINISDPRNPNQIITGNRRQYDDSLTPGETRRQAVRTAQEDLTKEQLIEGAKAVFNSKGVIDPKRMNKFIGEADPAPQKEGKGIEFLNRIFKKEVPPPTPAEEKVSAIQTDAEVALQKGLDPEFVQGYVQDSYKDQALQILMDNDEQISDANVQYVIEQLKAGKKN